MPYPVVKIEIALDDNPYAISPSWTNITPYVREFSTDRGRSDDWDNFESSASVVLDNRDRRFDPFCTTSPYWNGTTNKTKLIPRRQIQITATYASTVYPIFRGFTSGFSPVWTEAGKDSTVTLSCFDAIGLLSSETLPADWSRSYILSTSPRHYYPCDEPITPYNASGTLKDYGSVPLDMTTTAVASNGDQLAVGLVNSSVTGTGSDAANSALGSVISSAGSFSVSCWAVPDSQGTLSQFLQGYIYNHGFNFSYENATGKFRVEVTEPSFANSKVLTTTIGGWDSGTPRMFSFTWNSATRAITLYIDGILIASTTANNAGIVIPYNELVNIGSGSVQQVIVWDGVQTQAVLQNIYKYSTVAFSESTAARFQRIIAETPFPSGLTSPPSAPVSTVLELTDDAPKVSSELQLVADSEYGQLFVTRDGTITLYNQNQIRTQTRSVVSQGTYGAGGIAIGKEVSISYDGDSMRNQANVTMSKGGNYLKENTTSSNIYGVSEQSISTQVASLSNAESIGNIITGWGGEVYPKIEPFEVVLSPDNDWSGTLDRELNDRITVVVQPPSGNAITVPLLLSRIQHAATPSEWHTTFEGSARWAALFVLGQSLLGGTDLLG